MSNGIVYFKSSDEGDGTYDGQIGHAYLHLDDDLPESEGGEREDWEEAIEPRRSFLSRARTLTPSAPYPRPLVALCARA
jgi:hypothetical protein